MLSRGAVSWCHFLTPFRDAKGVAHTSPGQRPGFIFPKMIAGQRPDSYRALPTRCLNHSAGFSFTLYRPSGCCEELRGEYARSLRSPSHYKKILRNPLLDYQRLTKHAPFGLLPSASHFSSIFGPIFSTNPYPSSISRQPNPLPYISL